MFRVGDEVVCVNAGPLINGNGLFYDAPMLREGGVYTVFKAGTCPRGVPFVVVVEAASWSPLGFQQSRFRKVQRRKNDLSVESFLTIKPGFEEPRRVTTPTRKRERA